MPPPKELTIEVTNRCNLRCEICNIWTETPKRDLSLNAIKRIVSYLDAPVSIALTGGEPLLHPHINQIYRYLFRLFLKRQVVGINIATNAYSKTTLNFIRENKKYLLPLSLSVSLDGVAEYHNLQRGKTDAFSKTLHNIMEIKKAGILVELKFVISPLNYKDIFKVYLLSKRLRCNIYFKFFERMPNYYHRFKKNVELVLNTRQKNSVREDIKQIYDLEYASNRNDLVGISLFMLNQFTRGFNLDFINGCLTPEYSLFITSEGKIYNCLYQASVGYVNPSACVMTTNRYNMNIKKARTADCPRCLSYHGYLKVPAINRNYLDHGKPRY